MDQTPDYMLRMMMEQANKYYKANSPIPGVGFIEAVDPENPSQRRGKVFESDIGVDDVDGLIGFARVMRGVVYRLNALDAGVLCELNISVDKQPPEPSAVIYLDQKYGSARVLVAPLSGDALAFKDFGAVHPTINFFPELFSADCYGPMQAEA